jgi:hypothetical protein
VDQHHFGCNTKLPKKEKKEKRKNFFQVSMDNRHFGYKPKFLRTTLGRRMPVI